MKKLTFVSLSILAVLLIMTGCSEKSEQKPQEQQKVSASEAGHHPEAIVSPGAALTKVTGDYIFDTAGSPLFMDGRLYFTNNNFDQPEVSRTLRQNPDGSIDTLAMDNGVTTTLQASGKGTIYACQMLGHKVVELDTDGQIINTVAAKYNGTRIDGPNDIVVDQKGGLYFSDSQFIAGGQKMQETPAVYYVNEEGELSRVIDDIPFPNGMALSPEGTTLYVANTQGGHLLAYDVREDGTVHNKRDFGALKLAEGEEESGADGMAVDTEGNVYVATTKGVGVQIFNPQGKYLGNIETPTPSNNVSFGGNNNQILYITAQDGIYSIPVQIKGL
ncbi:SMP-30/gluconolactonase/LRE family protein [Fodinibius salsisoli]|uniref:SMP-30/gluconolactonase/LRE family protein n=1 Tax=Fodinibius salsisoli TaxID=2820877 RepID=A0ABT3PQ33_9BACT|nr:SMP-30/gluconolactonase/LRE family protein [Fodinibius salsisoli]MCW9707956.1 SMP-30/gluconolactonase/LRE family protein [Fodinibius salsisoli]